MEFILALPIWAKAVASYAVYAITYIVMGFVLDWIVSRLLDKEREEKKESVLRQRIEGVLEAMGKVVFTLYPLVVFAAPWWIRQQIRRIRFQKEFGFPAGTDFQERAATQYWVNEELRKRAEALRTACLYEQSFRQTQPADYYATAQGALHAIKQAKREVREAKTRFWRDGQTLATNLGYSGRERYGDYLL